MEREKETLGSFRVSAILENVTFNSVEDAGSLREDSSSDKKELLLDSKHTLGTQISTLLVSPRL